MKQPPYIVIEKGKSETLTCSQLTTNYMNMYWYKQEREKDSQLQLVIFSTEHSAGKVMEEFQKSFLSNGTKNSVLSLQLKDARMEDTGTYFCAKQDQHSEATADETKHKPLHKEMQAYKTTDLTQVQPEAFSYQR